MSCSPLVVATALVALAAASACSSREPGRSTRASDSGRPASTTPAKAPVIADAGPRRAEGAPPSPAPAPAKATAADARARRRFSEALREGRAAMTAHRYPQAVVAFEGALAMRPTDPVALCEAGWAHFSAGELDRAGERLRTAIAGLDAPAGPMNRPTLASCLYNLGRVSEQLGRREQAAEHYRRSIALRPNVTVQARLAGLGLPLANPAPPAAPPVPAPDFADLASAVQSSYGPEARPASGDELEGEGSYVVRRTLGPAGPVEKLVRVDLFSGGTQGCSLAGLYAQTSTGWVVVEGNVGSWCEVDHGLGGNEGLEIDGLSLDERTPDRALVILQTHKFGDGSADLVAHPRPGRDYGNELGRFVIYELTASSVTRVVDLVSAAHVTSSRWNTRCEDEAVEEGTPLYAVDCTEDVQIHVDWSTTVRWDGTAATFTTLHGTPPGWLLGTWDLDALRCLTIRPACG